MIATRLTTIAAVAVAAAFAPPALAAASEDLGKVHFETSCTAEAQQLFDRAMLYQHSFWYRASQKSFEDALKADPGCAIGYWGIALPTGTSEDEVVRVRGLFPEAEDVVLVPDEP